METPEQRNQGDQGQEGQNISKKGTDENNQVNENPKQKQAEEEKMILVENHCSNKKEEDKKEDLGFLDGIKSEEAVK